MNIKDEMKKVKALAKEMKSWKIVFYFFFPWITYLLFVLMLYFLLPSQLNIGFIMVTFFYLIPPAGKESMVPAGVVLLKGAFGIWSIPITAVSISFVDFFVGLWMMWNWDLIKLIPFLGTYITKLEEIGERKWKEHKYISKLAYIGLALFVAFPFQGSGGVGATVIGRLLGMDRYKILYSIVCGALFGTFLIASMAYFAVLSFQQTPETLWAIVGIIIFIVVIIIAIRWIRGVKDEGNGNWRSGIHR